MVADKDIGILYRKWRFVWVYADKDKVDIMENSEGIKYIVLIIYDISDDKHRRNLVKILSSFGLRVQKSAFEGRLNKRQYNKLLSKIDKYYKDGDNIRIYRLQEYEEVKVYGTRNYADEEIIVIWEIKKIIIV